MTLLKNGVIAITIIFHLSKFSNWIIMGEHVPSVDRNDFQSCVMANFSGNCVTLGKVEILVENRNFGQKSKFESKIEILVKNLNLGRKSKFWSKI